MTRTKEELELPQRTLFVLVLPVLIYFLNDQLLSRAGATSWITPCIGADVVSFRETSARLQYLAALLLFLGVALTAITGFVLALRALSAEARERVVFAAAVFVFLMMVALVRFEGNYLSTPGIPSDVGLPDTCPGGPACENSNYSRMLGLLGWWKGLLGLATFSVLFGTLCCMATERSLRSETVRARALRQQARRLDLFLGLSALLMTSALLVQLAFLRWPRFAIGDLARFDAHVGAVMLYYGVGYSIFLASFYLPAAWWLAEEARELKDWRLKDEVLRDLTIGPTNIMKRLAPAIVPAITGLLTAWAGLLG
jgi:hypothetical protein